MILRGLVPILCILTTTLVGNGRNSDARRQGVRAPLVSVLHDYPPEISPPRDLPFFYDLYTFRTDGGGTTVVAAVAVPVRRLRAERMDHRVRYRFDLRFVVADTARLTVSSTIDSVFVSVPRALSGQHLLHTYVEVEAAPSVTTVQRVIVTDAARPGRGQLYTTPFAIPDYSGSDLMLSDIALGLPDPKGGWTRRGATLALLPTSEFPESSFDLYYEIYNLPSGTPYETAISIKPLNDSDSDDQTVRTLFSGESAARADGSVAELRQVQSALPKGRYRLTVSVRDMVSGQTAARTRLIQVRGWRSGTTLVPAMPRGVGR